MKFVHMSAPSSAALAGVALAAVGSTLFFIKQKKSNALENETVQQSLHIKQHTTLAYAACALHDLGTDREVLHEWMRILDDCLDKVSTRAHEWDVNKAIERAKRACAGVRASKRVMYLRRPDCLLTDKDVETDIVPSVLTFLDNLQHNMVLDRAL